MTKSAGALALAMAAAMFVPGAARAESVMPQLERGVVTSGITDVSSQMRRWDRRRGMQCRTVVTRFVNRWGRTVVSRKRVCR